MKELVKIHIKKFLRKRLKNPTSEEYSEMLDEIDRTYEGMKKDKLIPENKDAIYNYFDRAIDLSDEMGNSYATGTVLTELQDMFDPDNLIINDLLGMPNINNCYMNIKILKI